MRKRISASVLSKTSPRSVKADNKLLGICKYPSEDTTCTVAVSLLGERPVQISGQGLSGSAQDHSVYFDSDLTDYIGQTAVSPGPSFTRDFSYKSDVSRGKLYYEIPGLETLLGSQIGSQVTELSSELFVAGHSASGSAQVLKCDTSSDCTVHYSMAYTPQINRIYPSTVYAGQDICFDVFTDYAVDGDRGLYNKSLIGEFTFEFDTYDDTNQASVSTWNNYQICGTAGGGTASSDNDLTIISGAGKYWVTEWAKSFDGTNEYTVRTMPLIEETSHSELYKSAGGILTIKGQGFSDTPSDNSVTVDDVNCNVFEASATHLKCTLDEKTTTTSASYFVGGMTAKVEEYLGTNSAAAISSMSPDNTLYYTDIDSRRNSDVDDNAMVRVIEFWFVPPMDGGYVFHASCDDHCTVELSTVDMDPSSSTQIMSIALNDWRNFQNPSRNISSAEQTLTAGEHYYMKVTHIENGGGDYATVGFTINDATTSYSNTDQGWKSLVINPNHDFEMYEIVIPNDDTANFRLKFSNDALECTGVTAVSDIFQCTFEDCPCISSSFSASSSETEFRNAVRSYLNSIRSGMGTYLVVSKEGLDSNGDVTSVEADIVSYRFTTTSRYAISSPSSETTSVFSDTSGVTGTVTRTQDSTTPLSGKYRIQIPLTNGTTVETEDIDLNNYNGHVTRKIYQAAPELIGKLELKHIHNNYISANEGKELYYRTKGITVDLDIIDSPDNPLSGGNETQGVTFDNTQVPVAASNFPFFETIPGSMVRAVETSPQVVVESNGIRGACPSQDRCSVSFIDDAAEVTAATSSHPHQTVSLTGTNIPTDNLSNFYVSFGNTRKCSVDAASLSSTSVTCNINNMIAGSHTPVLQTSKGAIANSPSFVPLEVDILITGLSRTQLHTSGGQTLVISGNFFPESLEEANSISDFSVKFNDTNVCTVTAVTSTQITCTSPANLSLGDLKIDVTFNGKTAQSTDMITISESAFTVTEVSPTHISPVLKQDLVITVSSLPSTNRDDYVAIIENSDHSIKMRVNSIDSGNNQLTVRFPGSPENADYVVFVEYGSDDRFKSDVTLAASSSITAIEIVTEGDPKTEISTTGGDIIKITGTGFSTEVSDNVVVFGDTYANVLNSSDTELFVRAGAQSSATTEEVKVFLKLSIESSCELTACEITYSDVGIPTLDSSSPLTVTDGVVTITGTNFGANAVGYVGDYPQITLSSSDTTIEIKLVSIADHKSISLEVRTDTVNLPAITLNLPITQSLVSVSPNTGSSGGEKLTFTTIGLGMSTVSDIDIYYGSGSSAISVCDEITLVDSSTVTCLTNRNTVVPSSELKMTFTYTSAETGSFTRTTLACSTASDCTYETTTAATPTITSMVKANSDTELQVSISGITFDNTWTVIAHYGNYEVSSATITGSDITFDFAQFFPPGDVDVQVSFESGDRKTFTASSSESVALSATIGSPVTCSWAGGCKLMIAQQAIMQGAQAGDISVEVCGNEAVIDLENSVNNEIAVIAPHYSTTHSLDTFMVEEAQSITGTVSSVPSGMGVFAFDGVTSTDYFSVSNDNCFVQVAFPSGKVGRVQKLKYFMNRMTDKQTNFVGALKFQVSFDGSTWTDEFTVDTYLREGWNTYEPSNAMKYQYYRFYSATKEACQIGEIELWGNIVEDTTATSKSCDVVVYAPGGQSQTFSSQVTYDDSASSVVTGISPRYGTYVGGETVTFTGSGFSDTASEVTVTIDGIDCAVTSATSTEIQCTTGNRPNIVADGQTIISFNGASKMGYASMQTHKFKYANYWSDLETWSGEFVPQDGDSVYIPPGQTLVVDVDSTARLVAVLVEGALIFQPDADPTHHRTFDAEYVYIGEGAVFEAGTEDERYTSKLTITMHGTRESAQIPVYGNKGIFVRYGQLDIHGVERDYTWSNLSETLEICKDQITLMHLVDWQVGEEIVIAPTDFDVDHAEAFKITEIDNSGSKSVITLNTTAQYKHYAGSTEYTATNSNGSKTKTLEMRAEVGLLTRNVKYKGADDDSVANRYGAHIMMHSPGDDSLTGRISYAEFTQVGQAFQLGRYPIHFHMIGTLHNSYIVGNAIHHTYNRACTIHGVHYLTIKDNVAYETMGHTFFIEDAIETKNLLQNNLAVKTKRSWSLLNTDQTPASFWITNPDNQFIGNHAAGSDRYGFWFDLQTHPTGPSFDPNICPEYEQLGEFTGNVAHSNGRYGLRIFHRFTPVTNPCLALAGGAFNNREQPDPTISEPIVTHFRDFLAYKNRRTGIIAEELGALKFHDVRVADNLLSGVEFGLTAAGPWLTSSDDYHLQDALIVGASENVDEVQVSSGGETSGLKGARTEKMRFKDTIFANFDYDDRWGAIATCSHCEGPATDSSGRTYFTSNLYFADTTKRVRFDIPFKEIIYDEDGTLGNSTHRWVVSYFEHLDVPECERNEEVYSGLICHMDISIRRIVFSAPKPDNALKGLTWKVINMNRIGSSVTNSDVSPDTCVADATALTTIDQWDTETYAEQKSLLEKYDEYRVARETYVQALNEAEANNNATAASIAATATTTMENLSLEIDALEASRDESYGKFDDLWKTDANICNTNNYGEIEFRGKANPMKNIGFNVITGYEYKVHIRQGADFDSVTGQYSYPELLNGETKGVVLHWNITERTEALYYKYTESDNSTTMTVEPKESKILLSDSSMMIGDMYLNNVTRHAAIKFDGQDSDKTSFLLQREECITVGGCNNKELPDEGDIETEYRYWSDPNAWTDVEGETGVIPVEGDEVIIQSTWNMVLDVTDPPVFKSIEINGRLTILNDGNTYTLQSYLIYVRKGELIVGTEEEPITGQVNFILHGDRSDQDVYFHDKMFEGGNKVIANTGKLRMYGKPVDVKWTRLAAVAPAGQSWIMITDTPSDWKSGDELGITPSGRDWEQRDFVTIESISGNNVSLTAPLTYEHFGAATQTETDTGNIDIRAEVMHLTRNIKVSGTNEDGWGGHLVTAHNQDSGFVDGTLVTVERKGHAIIDHVEFMNCSQYDTDKASVRFADFFALEDTDTYSVLSNSAIHNGLGIGVMVTSADHVTIDNNVIFFHHIGGIWMKASDDTTITNNVVGGFGTRYWSDETRLDELAGFNLCNKDQNCANLIVKNNIMGGAERIGFLLPTVSCTESSPSYENNMAHSVEHGAWLLKNNLLSGCQAFNNFKAYKTDEQGVFAYQGYQELEVSNIETLDCSRGVHLMIGSAFETNKITLSDSLIMGQTNLLPEDPSAWCVESYGYWLSAASNGGKVVPEKLLSAIPYEKIKTYANWFTEAFANNITFKNWDSGFRSCNSARLHRIFGINDHNADHVPVQTFDGVVFDNVHDDSVAHLYDPPQAWAIIKDCGEFPCTAPHNAIIKLNSASATGSNTPTSIPDIASGNDVQIIPNNIWASPFIENCTEVTTWNAYICTNNKLAQLMFESLDSDKEDRTVSPIYIIDKNTSSSSFFNNTLNTFMDHCWDGHYTCQKRLSRFPSMIVLNDTYEIYYTGTPPSDTRYVIEGASSPDDWLHLMIDFSQARLYKVYANDVEVPPNDFDPATNELVPIQYSHCGENVYFKPSFLYEFYLTYNCTVKFEAQDFLEGMVRLAISYDDFFNNDGIATFKDKLASALGITQDKIRIVSVISGSIIVDWYVTSALSTSALRQKELKEYSDKLAVSHSSGSLDLGYTITDLTTSVVSSTGEIITGDTSDYSTKEISAVVFVILAFAAIAVLVGIAVGIFKAVKMAKAYNSVVDMDTIAYEKGANESQVSDVKNKEQL